jgi:hypothetical protein
MQTRPIVHREDPDNAILVSADKESRFGPEGHDAVTSACMRSVAVMPPPPTTRSKATTASLQMTDEVEELNTLEASFGIFWL